MNQSRLIDYLRLIRAPNVFTAMADVLAGFLITHHGFAPVLQLTCLLLASSLLYIAGMVLNDVFDVEIDRIERPKRPLPSGRISVAWARWLGIELLIVGVIFGAAAGFIVRTDLNAARPGLIALALAGAVLLYDAWAKKTPLGPFVMGSCRLMNWLLGMSLGGDSESTSQGVALAPYADWQLTIAIGIGIYISGVTWFARNEAQESSRWSLAFGGILMTAGIGLLAVHPIICESRLSPRFDDPFVWPLVLMILMAPTIRRCVTAIANPVSTTVQASIRSAIFSLVVLDASLAFLHTGGLLALGIVLLFVPMITLGRWVYST